MNDCYTYRGGTNIITVIKMIAQQALEQSIEVFYITLINDKIEILVIKQIFEKKN